MSDYDSAPRPLPWDLRSALVFDRTVEDDECEPSSSFVWPDDPDERTTIVFKLSLNEYNVLGSTIDVGSDIAYGADALRVVWLWLRNMRCPVSICEQMIDCIDDDEDVQDTIVDMLGGNDEFQEDILDLIGEHPGGIEFPINQSIPEWVRLTFTQPDPCDQDQLWGQCKGVVAVADTMIKQFFAAWSTYLDDSSIILGITRNVPLLQNVASALGIAGVTGYAALLVSSITALYVAAADDTYKEQLACVLFCRAQLRCYVDIQTAQGVLNARIGNILSEFANSEYIMETLISLDLTGLNVADVYMAAFFNLIGCANLLWPDVWGVDAFLNAMSAYQVGDSGWSVCDDCDDPQLNIVTFGGWEHWTTTYQGIDSHGWEIWDIEDMANTGFPTFAVYSASAVGFFYIRQYETLNGNFVTDADSFTQNGGAWTGDHFDLTLRSYACSAEGGPPFLGNIMRLHLEPSP